MSDPALALVAEMQLVATEMRVTVEQLRTDVDHMGRVAARSAGLHAQRLANVWVWKNLALLALCGVLLCGAGGVAGFLLYPRIALTCVEKVCYEYR